MTTRDTHPAVPWLIRAVAASAATLSGVLLWRSLSGAGVPGCGPGSGCDAVLSSGWSRVGGVPVAAPAVAVYAAALAAALHIGPRSPEARRRGAWPILIAASYAAALAAVWFTAVQIVGLGTLCKWCTAVHAHGLVLAGLVLVACPFRGRPAVAAAGTGALATTALVVLQLAMPAATVRVDRAGGAATADAAGSEALYFLGGSVRLVPRDFPLIGPADAPVMVIEMYDYTCPHCRRLHELMEAAVARYGERLAVIALPVPLDAQCNPLMTQTDPRHATACELATAALAVWRADPAAFPAMHDWLMRGETSPTPEAALDRAQALVGVEPLGRALLDPLIPDLIGRTARLYQLTDFRGGSLPRLITQNAVVTGRPATAEGLFELLEAETALESPDAAGPDAPAPKRN